MVLAVNPERLLVKLPVPFPLLVILSAVVGLLLIPQTIPLEVIVDPPSFVTFPPDVAPEVVMFPMGKVVSAAKLKG